MYLRYSQQASGFFELLWMQTGSTCQNFDRPLLPFGMFTTSNLSPPLVTAFGTHIWGRNHGPSTFIALRPFWMP